MGNKLHLISLIGCRRVLAGMVSVFTFGFSAVSVKAQTAGRLTFERWTGMPASWSVLTLQQEGISKRSPNFSGVIGSAEWPAAQGENYGVRLRGSILAPITGNYTFFVAGDDNAELWLSPDSSRFNKNRIAWTHVWTNPRQWDKFPSQRSRPIYLQSGQRYYLEALMQEQNGGDHLSLGWAYEAPVKYKPLAVGSPVTHSWAESNGTISLSAEGGDIWGTADRFGFYQRSWTGDGEIVARVASMNNPQGWAKVGVMIRATVDAGSIHAMMVRSSSNGMAFQRRKTANGVSVHTGVSPARDWVKLVRKGPVITGFTSADGVDWVQVGSETFVNLPQSLVVGLAASDASASLVKPVIATVTHFEVRPLQATEVIPASQLASLSADPGDLDDDNIPDKWEVEKGISATSKLGSNGQYGDFDNDGISNFEEFRYNSNPKVKDVLADGLIRERWENLPGSRVADLTGSRSRFLRLPEDRGYVPNVDESKHGDKYGSRYRGFVIAPVSGEYRFWIAGDNEAELWFADASVEKSVDGQNVRLTNRFGKKRVAMVADAGLDKNQTALRDFDRHPSQRSLAVTLAQGQSYYIEILHKENTGGDHVSVAWQVPGALRAVIPSSAFTSEAPESDDLDDDNLPGTWEIQYGLKPTDNGITDSRDGQYGDWDSDGLTNLEEYQEGTNPKLSDTDADGTDDLSEIRVFGSDPTMNDMTSNSLVETISVTSGETITGVWRHSGDGGVYSSSPYAKMDFSFKLARDGIYLLQIEGHVGGVDLLAAETIPFGVSVDGVSLPDVALIQKKGMKRATRVVLLPYLRAGSHVLRLVDLNIVAGRKSYIDALQILSPGGSDTNGDGASDWTSRKIDEENTLSKIPLVSKVSPVCLEGRAAHAEMTSAMTAEGLSIPAVAGPDDTWFLNLPLSESTETLYSVAFENGAKVVDVSTLWIPTNILAGGTVIIRKNDSLRFTAFPLGGTPDKGAVSIQGAEQSLQTTADAPRTVSFSTAGTFRIDASYKPVTGGAIVNGSLTVRVEEGSFGGDFPVFVGRKRNWSLGSLKVENTVTWDSQVVGAELPAAPPARLLAVSTGVLGPHRVVARTSDGGAILARGTIVGYNIASTYGTRGVRIINTYPNGDRIVEMRVAVSELPPGCYLKLVIFAAGVTFDDGTRTKLLRLSDFGKDGVAFVRFNYPKGTRTSVCHRLYICDAAGNVIGER
jgi:hypothetical protein